MSDIERQPASLRLEDGEIDESGEPLVLVSPVIGFTHHSLPFVKQAAKRGNGSSHDEIAAVLARLGEGDNEESTNLTAIPTSSSQGVYRIDEESELIDEDEMLCVRGASPLPFVVDRRSLTRKSPPCDGNDFDREVITPQKRRKTSSKRRRGKQSTPRKVIGEKSFSPDKDRNDSKSGEGSQSPSTPPQKLDQLCKFYHQDACAKGRSCEYMHSEFPCKFYYTGYRCDDMENNGRCKLSHNGPLSNDMMATLIRHIYTAPDELLGEQFIALRATMPPGEFSVMIYRMHEKLLVQEEEPETATADSQPNIIANMREQLSYFLSEEQLNKLILLRVSKPEDLLSLTLAQLNAIGISAIQIEAIQLTLLSSQDVDMRCLFPPYVAQTAEPNEIVLPEGDVDLRASNWYDEDELPLVIDESYELQDKEAQDDDDDDDTVIDVVGDTTPPFVCCGPSEVTDEKYSNTSEVVICAAIDPLLDIAEQYRSDTQETDSIAETAATPLPENIPIDDPVASKCDKRDHDIRLIIDLTDDNKMSVQEDEESYKPPLREEESYTPPSDELVRSSPQPLKVPIVESYTPPSDELERSSPQPLKSSTVERHTPPSDELERSSPSPLKVPLVDTLHHAYDSKEDVRESDKYVKERKEHVEDPKENFKDPKEHFKEPKEHVKEPKKHVEKRKGHIKKPKENVKEPNEHEKEPQEYVKDPKEQIKEPKVTSIRSRRSTRFSDVTKTIDFELPEYGDEPKAASNRRKRHKSEKRASADSDRWKYHNEPNDAPKRSSSGRHESNSSHRNGTSSEKETWDEISHRQYQEQDDLQMQSNNSSEDWDAEEQNEIVPAAKRSPVSSKEIVCIDSPDNSDDETAAIFANSTCPDLPRRTPNLDNYKPALEIDAHLTYPAMEYKLYQIYLPHYEVNKPTLMDKLVKANSSDPRLKKFLEKEKNYGFLPQSDYSFFPPSCNSQCDPRLRSGIANVCPEQNYNSSPILYGYLQRSLWYQELKSNLKIQINHSVSDLVRALNAFHKDPTTNKIFDLFQIECAGVLLEVMQNVGIFVDVQGDIIELSNYQQLCAVPQHPASQSYTNNKRGNSCSGAGPPPKPGLLGYAPPGIMYPRRPMTPPNNEKSFMQQAFGNDYPLDYNNNNNNGVQPPESGFYVRERNFNRNCGADGNGAGGGGGPSDFKQSHTHYRRPQKRNFNRRM